MSMAAAKWNSRPAYTEQPLLGSQLSRGAALQSVASYAAVALAAVLTSRYGLPVLTWLHVPHIAAIGAVLELVAVLGLGGAVAVVLKWRDSNARAAAQAGLGPDQRKLLGLPPTPPPTSAPPPEAASAAARAATLLATPVTSAQRMPVFTLVSDAAPRQLLATPGSAGRSSWTAGSPATKMSPWSAGRAVATPDQLSRYLQHYSATPPAQQQQQTPLAAAAAVDAAAAAPDTAAGVGGSGFGGYGGAAAGLYGGHQEAGGGQGQVPSSTLPLGRDAPAYRPSLWPRKAAAGGPGGDALAPSADADTFMEEVLQLNVATNAPTQLVWIERLREWLASELLQPLAHHILTAHELPNQAIATCAPNAKEFLLPPIPQLLGLDVPEAAAGSSSSQQQYSFGCNSSSSGGSSVGALALPGAGAGGLMLQAWNFTGMLSGGGLGGRGGQNPAAGGGQGGGGGSSVQQGQGGGGGQAAAAVVEDAISRAQQLRDQLYGQQLMQGFDPQELRMALHRYSELLLLLTGRRPSELLPPTPPSYTVNRVWQLAHSTCVKDFNWNGGGAHAGQQWTPELPCDSALLFYLFAAFVAAPGWNFPPPGAGGPDNSRGPPLYVGSVPGSPPASYSALLAYKPDKPGTGAAAMVASQMASREPRFSLLLLGHQFSLCERDGFFKVLLWWLRYHLVERQGLMGGRSLGEEAFGGLQGVLGDADERPTIPQRVFNWWYPARRQ